MCPAEAQKRSKILIVEDEPDINDFLAETLGIEGYGVAQAYDGPMGIQLAKEFLPDLILLDVMMPKLNGIEVCRRLRAQEVHKNTKIVFITAHGNLEDKIEGFRAGADDFLSKPFAPSELLARIEAHLRLVTLANKLSLSENKYKNLIYNMPDGLMLVNESLGVDFYSPKCAELLNIDDKSLKTGTLKNIFHASRLKVHSEKISELILKAMKTSCILTHTITLKDEKFEAIEIRVMPNKAYGQTTSYAQVILRDVTDKFNMDRLLGQAEKINSLGMLISGVSHEINNPLAGISNAIHLLRKNTYDETKRSNIYGMILENVTRITRVIDDLRLFGHLERVDTGEFSVGDAIEEAVKVFKYQCNNFKVNLTLKLNEKVKYYVMGSRTQFIQMVVNFLLNAYQAVECKGSIKITLESSDSTPSYVIMTIEDDGCGISEAEVSQIFDPFFIAKKEWQGMGLGLAISYRIVQLLKGTIKVVSKLGKGTKFIISLPLKEP
jgi:two-component system cell cycle sensor histidine kinase/response regulator CckA